MSSPAPVIGGRWRALRLLSMSERARVLEVEPVEGGAPCVLKIEASVNLLTLPGAPWSRASEALFGVGAPRSAVEQEARALARLSHPAIPVLLDQGHEEGRAWVVMERRAGARLDRLRGALPAPLLRVALRGWLEALSHLRARGVLHRDLHPRNLLVDPQTGEASLLDFGLCALDGAGTPGEVGSAAWRAPEVLALAESALAWVDERADLYALGVSIYWFLSGRLPYEGGERGGEARSEGAAPPALAVEPPGLGVWVQELLSVAPGDRPADAEAALARLELLWGDAEALDLEAEEARRAARAARFSAALGVSPAQRPYAWRRLCASGALDRGQWSPQEARRALALGALAEEVERPGDDLGRARRALGLGDLAASLGLVRRRREALEAQGRSRALAEALALEVHLLARFARWEAASAALSRLEAEGWGAHPQVLGLKARALAGRGEVEAAVEAARAALEAPEGLWGEDAARLSMLALSLGAMPEALAAALRASEASSAMPWSPCAAPRLEPGAHEALPWLAGMLLVAHEPEEVSPEALAVICVAAQVSGLRLWVEGGQARCGPRDAAWHALQVGRELGLSLSLLTPEAPDPVAEALLASVSWALGQSDGDAFAALAVAHGLFSPARREARPDLAALWWSEGLEGELPARAHVVALALRWVGQASLSRVFAAWCLGGALGALPAACEATLRAL